SSWPETLSAVAAWTTRFSASRRRNDAICCRRTGCSGQNLSLAGGLHPTVTPASAAQAIASWATSEAERSVKLPAATTTTGIAVATTIEIRNAGVRRGVRPSKVFPKFASRSDFGTVLGARPTRRCERAKSPNENGPRRGGARFVTDSERDQF